MRNLFVVAIGVLVIGCNMASNEHLSVGRWKGEDHVLVVYENGSMSFNGIAGTWEWASENGIKIDITYKGVPMIWDFSVSGQGSPLGLVLSNPVELSEPDEKKMSKLERRRFYGVMTKEDSLKLRQEVEQDAKAYLKTNRLVFTRESDFSKRISEARAKGLEVGTIIIGGKNWDFIREQ